MNRMVGVLVGIALLLTLAVPASAEVLTLDKAIEMALENNHALRAAQYNASAANWGLGQAISGWLPHVYFNSSWSRPDEDTLDEADEYFEMMKAFDPSAKRTLWEDNYSSSIYLVQPIFNGGAEYVAIHSAAINRETADLAAQDTYLQVALEVKKAYYEALKTKALFRVVTESLSLARQSLELANARREVGQATVSDVLRWEAEVANAEGSLAEADNAFALAKMALAQVIGEAVDREIELPELDVSVSPEEMQQAEMAATADTEAQTQIGNHPAVQAQDNAVELARVSNLQSIGALLPNVNFTYNYSWETNDTMELDGDTAWTMGIGVEIPLFQSFGAVSGIGSTCRQLHATRMNVESYRRTFLQRTFAARLNLRAGRLRVLSAQKATQSAEANLHIVESREQLGMANNLELLDAQLAYKTAQSNLISAISDFKIALADWEYVTAAADE